MASETEGGSSNLVQLPTLTRKVRLLATMHTGQSIFNVGQVILVRTGGNTRILQGPIGIQPLEEVDGLLEEIPHLLLGLVVRVAGRGDGVYAGAVFGPLV